MGAIVSWLMRRYEPEMREYLAAGKPRLTGETATSVDDIYGLYWGVQRYNPDQLAAKKGGLGIYKKMREDDQVKAALHLKKAAIIHPGWDIEGEDEQQNEFVEAVFDGMEGTVEGAIRSILSAYDYGFSLHEKVYRYIEAGPFAGRLDELFSAALGRPVKVVYEHSPRNRPAPSDRPAPGGRLVQAARELGARAIPRPIHTEGGQGGEPRRNEP